MVATEVEAMAVGAAVAAASEAAAVVVAVAETDVMEIGLARESQFAWILHATHQLHLPTLLAPTLLSSPQRVQLREHQLRFSPGL